MMFPQKPITSLHNLLISSWRHDQGHHGDHHHPSDPPRVLYYSDNLSGFTAQDKRYRIRQRLLERCEQYVLNYLPTHLLRISDKSLVTRTEFWEAERSRVENNLEEDLDRFTRPMEDNGDHDATDSPLRKKRRMQTQVDEAAETDAVRHHPTFLEASHFSLSFLKYIRGLFRFAIFSHRWGDDEPQFCDILDRHLIEKPTIGYEKLLHFCERASIDFDCCYVWSDTCCIDKESSVELDEAIRSMYRWYSIATVCIVHLAESSTIDDFETEPWFTRGWTLQELLAPEVIRLYGKNWKPIWREKSQKGDKAIKEIWGAIERVTGVPHAVLWHFSPSCDRVAEKMIWASQRRTTKIEDMAYSLLGLFNVSLPIAYGEADRAWYRLMVVIANECTDASFFAWAGQPSPYSRALPSSPASYSKLDPHTPVSIFNHRHPSYEVTKLGVSIKMLVIPARCSTLEDGQGREIGYTVIPHNLEPFLIGADVPPGRIEEYKLGIVNFHSVGDTARVEMEDTCHCLVLAKEHTGDRGWILMNTECVIVVRCFGEICASPETVLLYHGTLRPRFAHQYHPAIESETADSG